MKILHIIETLGRGGAERGLVDLLLLLRSHGIECEVAALYGPYTLASELEKQGIRVHRLDLSHRWSIIEGIFKVAALLQKGHFDIIHARLFFASLYTALSRPLRPSIYRVTSFHNETFIGFPANTLWKKFRKQMESLLTRYWIDGHVAISAAVAQDYATNLKLPHIKVIHNAFPIDILRPTPNLDRQAVLAHYGVDSKKFVIIAVGRLVPQKGYDTLLQALEILKSKGLFPSLIIFGDGPLENEIRHSLMTKQLLEQVILHDAIPQNELLPVIQASDILVMPSKFEGFGRAAAEAMALERPVIASRVGGLMEFIEDGVSGILVPVGDATLLAASIERLMADELLRKQLGQAARKRIETDFSLEKCAERYVNYYETLLTNNKN
jgi:glycosyltransferase involved in cell wall biosynthesis